MNEWEELWLVHQSICMEIVFSDFAKQFVVVTIFSKKIHYEVFFLFRRYIPSNSMDFLHKRRVVQFHKKCCIFGDRVLIKEKETYDFLNMVLFDYVV